MLYLCYDITLIKVIYLKYTLFLRKDYVKNDFFKANYKRMNASLSGLIP